MKFSAACIFALCATALALSPFARAQDDKPKMTIKEAMKLHKDKINEKMVKGTATDEEKKKLQEAYEAMGKNKPPKGDEKEWKTKTDALVKAIKDNDKEAYAKAVNCMACHSAHKPK
jgi:hypothetical protein